MSVRPSSATASCSRVFSRSVHRSSTGFPRRRPRSYDELAAITPESNQIAAPSDASSSFSLDREEISFPYEPPQYPVSVRHPSYASDEIMDFRDRSAKYPPHLAAKRQDKLSQARNLGLHHTQMNKSRRRDSPLPTVPVRLEYKVQDEKVKYQVGKVGVTNERRSYFAEGEDDMTSGGTGVDWSVVDGETTELEPGRIVEVRRSGQMSIGMVLAALVVSGRQRMLLLRSNGEIWPISTNDVQFVMPSSLIKPSLAEQCWSPELVDLWAQGDEASGSDISAAMGPMQEARRTAVLILRKIMRETERMCGKMIGDIGRSKFGGMEGVWDRAAPKDADERSSITSSQAAEFILNAQDSSQAINVKPNTLPAYAAHCLLMNRADLFLADQGDMASSGRFMVRSRAERAQMQHVSRMIDGKTPQDQAVFARFIDKARNAAKLSIKLREETDGTLVTEYKAVEHDLPAWTHEEKAIISSIINRLYESRSTQSQASEGFATSVMKLMQVYPDQTLDRDLLGRLLTDLGALPPWETLKRSELLENTSRGYSSSGLKLEKKDHELLQGNELDELRHDFTNQKVFVVDDATASELDDGISVERIHDSKDVWLHVHIADPTRFIPLNSSIATKASFQGSSLYLVEGNVPLFPLEVIMKELSLGANVSRDDGAQGTMTFSTRLSPDGDVLDSTVRMGWVKKPKVVTYNAVNEILGVQGFKSTKPLGTPINKVFKEKPKADLSSEDVENLKLIQHLATTHRSKRLATAGLEYQNISGNIHLVTQVPSRTPQNMFAPDGIPDKPMFYPGQPIIDYSVSTTPTSFTKLPSTMMIAEFMIIAGRTAAQFCGERNLPVPYRLSQAPKLVGLPGHPALSIEDLLSRRDPDSKMTDIYSIAAANIVSSAGTVSMSPGQHWAMGFTDNVGYIRATSPLRRFDDMLVHWQIKSALAKEKGLSASLAPAISAGDMETLVKRSDPAQRKARRAGITAREFWEAGLFASRLKNPRPEGYEFGDDFVDISQPLVGRVSGPTIYASASSSTTPMNIPALGFKARLPNVVGKRALEIGEEVKVRLVKSVQWPAPLIDVELVD